MYSSDSRAAFLCPGFAEIWRRVQPRNCSPQKPLFILYFYWYILIYDSSTYAGGKNVPVQ
jgi:hypothetical protein